MLDCMYHKSTADWKIAIWGFFSHCDLWEPQGYFRSYSAHYRVYILTDPRPHPNSIRNLVYQFFITFIYVNANIYMSSILCKK